MPRRRNTTEKQTLHFTASADRRFAAAVDRLLRVHIRAPVLPAYAEGECCSEAEARARLQALTAEADEADCAAAARQIEFGSVSGPPDIRSVHRLRAL